MRSRGHLFLIICLLAFGAFFLSPMLYQPVFAQSNQPDQRVVERVLQILQSHPEFVGNLQQYEEITAQIQDTLSFVQPIVSLFDELKSTNLPLIGNAWDGIVKGLNKAAPGSGLALETFDETIRQLFALRQKTIYWHQQLQDLIAAVNTFERSPSPQTLENLDRVSANALATLKDMENAIREVRSQTSEISKNLDRIGKGVDGIGGMNVLPSWMLSELRDLIVEIQSPIQQLDHSLAEVQVRIREDQKVINEIQRAIHGSNPVQNGSSSFALILVLIFGVALVVWLISLSQNQKSNLSLSPSSPKVREVTAPIQANRIDSPPIIRKSVLRVVEGSIKGKYWSIDKTDVFIGRGRDCYVQIPDLAVSRKHARLRFAQGAWFIQDQGSKAGLYVNGQLVQATRLKHGDRVMIGNNLLVFYEEGS